MVLADALANYRDEAEADLAQYYGVDLTRIGQSLTYTHAGCLLAQLPANARLYQAARGDDPWGDDILLCSIANSLRVLPAQLSGKRAAVRKVAQFGPAKPKTKRRLKGVAMTCERFDEIMRTTRWREVEDDG